MKKYIWKQIALTFVGLNFKQSRSGQIWLLCPETHEHDHWWAIKLWFNSLNPNIIKILLTGLHTHCWVLFGRMCWNIKTVHHWWLFPYFSWPVCVLIHWCDEEKFDADHYWGLKCLESMSYDRPWDKKKSEYQTGIEPVTFHTLRQSQNSELQCIVPGDSWCVRIILLF